MAKARAKSNVDPARGDAVAARWSFLEREPYGYAVVTKRMEVVYLSPMGRGLVPENWYGARCWEVFPVGDSACASRCPAVAAVGEGLEPIYCEETIYPTEDTAVLVGVAVMPLGRVGPDGEQALLVLKPKTGEMPDLDFREDLLDEAARVYGLGIKVL